MKKLLLALGILALICSPAMAGRNANGVMAVHTNDAENFSVGWDYCANNPLPGTLCEDLVPTSNRPVEVASTLVWIVGGWMNSTSPGVTAYQFGIYHNLPPGYFDGFAACGPGALEIPDAGWPETSGTGTAIAYGAPVYPAWTFKMYWFAPYGVADGFFGTGPYSAGPAQFADDGNPPATDDCFRFGTLRWAPGAGSNDCPVPPREGACCYPDGHCEYVLPENCQGVFQGTGTVCNPNPCPPPIAACCFETGACVDLLEADCLAQGGNWIGYPNTCATYTCPPPAREACCFGDGSCQDLMASECTLAGGTPQGVGTSCATVQCPQLGACCTNAVCTMTLEADCGGESWHAGEDCATFQCPPVATKPATWGQIKSNYR